MTKFLTRKTKPENSQAPLIDMLIMLSLVAATIFVMPFIWLMHLIQKIADYSLSWVNYLLKIK